MRALVIEDHPRMSALLRQGLEEEGYAVDASTTLLDGMSLAGEHEFDDIVVIRTRTDRALRQLRSRGVWAPVLILTAKDAVDDRVRGLDAGADDYLVKPFALPELLARLRALVRRTPPERPAVVEVGNLTLDPATHAVARNGTPIHLTPKEFSLLELLMRRAGQVVPRAALMEHGWDFAYEGDWNILEVYMRYLREKVDRPFGRSSIETVRGVGYRLRSEEDGGA